MNFDDAELEGLRSERDMLQTDLIVARQAIARLLERVEGLKIELATIERQLKYYGKMKLRSARQKAQLRALNKHCKLLQLMLDRENQKNSSLGNQLRESRNKLMGVGS